MKNHVGVELWGRSVYGENWLGLYFVNKGNCDYWCIAYADEG